MTGTLGRTGMVLLVALLALPMATTGAQDAQEKGKKEKKQKSDTVRTPKEAAPLFRSETPISFTLTANFGKLRGDKGANAPWRDASLTYTDSAGQQVELPVHLRTRGIWRLNNCAFPPLRLDFAKADVKQSIFAKLDKPKLVTHCKNQDEYDQYILQEAQLYRVYSLLTPLAFRSRLARVTYVDSASRKEIASRYAILTEEVDELTQRTATVEVKQQGATPNDLEPNQSALFGLFQFFVGNTDFAISALHNVRVVHDNDGIYALPYDFDWTGVVNLPIARPDPRLGTKWVTQRLYRGFCVEAEPMQRAIEKFVASKDAIYALYRDSVGALIKPDGVKTTLAYYDEFYKTIADPKAVKRQILEACVGRR